MLEGNIAEIFSSIQGEGGTVRGSCYGKRQIFIRFAGCNIAIGDYKTTGCFWCDTPRAQKPDTEYLIYQKTLDTEEFTNIKNPVKISEIIGIMKNLIAPGLHSISLTGGEPLHQLDFMKELITELNSTELNLPLYLETNGSIKLFEKDYIELAKYIKFCCCDIKDKSSKAALIFNWNDLVKNEIEFISKMVEHGVNTFAKIVVTSNTYIEDIEMICKSLANIKYPNGETVGLAIQPVMLEKEDLKSLYSIPMFHLNKIFYKAAEYLNPESISLSVQAHKFLHLL